MLNLDFDQTKDGLIPSKTPYGLHVPLQDLGIEYLDHRNVLAFQEGQGLDIPHSSLLDPNGDEWIVSVRVFPLTDGIVFNQGNDEHGVVIYVQDGNIRAAVRTGMTSFILREREDLVMTKHLRRWVTVELRIKKDMTLLSLNRRRVAMAIDQPALNGEELRIRLGQPRQVPASISRMPNMQSAGFTGAIASLKILRQ